MNSDRDLSVEDGTSQEGVCGEVLCCLGAICRLRRSTNTVSARVAGEAEELSLAVLRPTSSILDSQFAFLRLFS